MDTVRYLRALTRSWWLILLTLLAGGLGGFLVYHQTTPLYRSSVSLIVASRSPQADVVSAQALTSQQATALARIATTGPAVGDALKAAKVAANSTLVVSASSSDSFVSISVSDSDAGVAAAVANAYPATLPGSLKRLAGANGTPYNLNILGSSGRAGSPYAPDWKRDIGLGLAAGLILGFALAVLRETLNRTVTDSGALRELTGLTVLGTVPRHSPKVLLPARSEPRSARAEAYRQVRTTLLSRATHRPLVVAVTSASLGEGKTSVACNVAAIFSRAGHRVALVDADLRRPRVGTFFGLGAGPGLSDVLTNSSTLDEALHVLDDGRLGVLAAGHIPLDPAELLGSEPMVEVLRRLAADFEFVFVDTPPVLPVTDALILAPIVDGMIIVAKLQGTTEDRITRAIEAVQRVNATIIGLVPNQASAGVDRDYGYGYRYSQGRTRSDRLNEVTPAPTDPAHLPDEGQERHNVAALIQKYGSSAAQDGRTSPTGHTDSRSTQDFLLGDPTDAPTPAAGDSASPTPDAAAAERGSSVNDDDTDFGWDWQSGSAEPESGRRRGGRE